MQKKYRVAVNVAHGALGRGVLGGSGVVHGASKMVSTGVFWIVKGDPQNGWFITDKSIEILLKAISGNLLGPMSYGPHRIKWLCLKMETSNINLFVDNTSFVWDPTFRQTLFY